MRRKSFIICLSVLLVTTLINISANAGVIATGHPLTVGWPTLKGLPPKAQTCDDPNSLPCYTTIYGDPGGTIRIFFTPVNGGGLCQTFSTDGNSDGFALTRIAIRASGAGSSDPDMNYPFTVHLYDVNANYGWVPGTFYGAYQYIITEDAKPYSGSFDFLSGPAFAADPCLMMYIGECDTLNYLDFNGIDNVDLEPNHTYALEVWGPLGWTDAPPYIWGMVWNSQENTYINGCGYQPKWSGWIPGAAYDLTNPRVMALGGTDHDFVVAVYGDYADGNAFHPSPKKHQTGISTTPTLTWSSGKWAKDHQVWFHTNFNVVAHRTPIGNKGRFTDPSYTPTSTLALNTTYYWRVDEYNDTPTVPVPYHPDGNSYWGVDSNPTGDTADRSTIYRFKTISPAATNPDPESKFPLVEAAFKPQAAQLSWTKGALVQDINGHQVYFDTNAVNVANATTSDTTGIYRGAVTDPCYPLSNLAGAYTLTTGTAYYWRVDEVNGVDKWTGSVWKFKMPSPATIMIDDFASSGDFTKYWKTGYRLPYTPPGCDGNNADQNKVSGNISLVSSSLSLAYENSYTNAADYNGPWSEAMLDYNNPSGVDWTLGGIFEPKAIGVLFNGDIDNTLNSADANNDKLYLGIEDTSGNLGVVYYSDVYAAQRQISIEPENPATREFKVALTDLTGPNNIDITKMRKVFVGIGGERGAFQGLGFGGTGTMRYDNIKIYVKHCNPTYPQESMVAGDLAGPIIGVPTGYHTRWTTPDCVVDLHDIYYLAADWLYAEPNLNYSGTMSNPGTANLTVYYKFDEGSGTAIADSSGNGKNGTLHNLSSAFTWAYKGHDDANHCVNLEPGYKTWIECPNSIIAGTEETGQTFTFWLWHNVDFRQAHEWSSVLVFHSTAPGAGDAQTMETQLPAQAFTGGTSSPFLRWVDRRPGTDETGLQGAGGSRPSMIWGRWNHYALVYDTVNTQMRMYVNGKQISGASNTGLTTPWGPSVSGDGNANTVRIGTRSNDVDPVTGGNNEGGFWNGRIDDMRLYSKALSVGEVQYLATDGTGTRDMQAIFIERDNYNNSTVTSSYLGGQPVQIINFNDFAGLAGYWLNQQLWP
jgi:hypothetical protein